MDPALMGAIVIACCFAAGVFETGRRNSSSSKPNRNNGTDDSRPARHTHNTRGGTR